MQYDRVLAALEELQAVEVVGGHAWYALRVLPQREFVVRSVLRRRGIEAVLPTRTKWIRANRHRKGEKKLVSRVLLVGYVLARLPLPIEWSRLRRIHIITGILGMNGAPLALPQEGVTRLLRESAKHDAKPEQRAMPTNRTYAGGDEVEMLDGSLEGAPLTVIEVSEGVAKVLADFLGAPRRMSIAADRLGSV